MSQHDCNIPADRMKSSNSHQSQISWRSLEITLGFVNTTGYFRVTKIFHYRGSGIREIICRDQILRSKRSATVNATWPWVSQLSRSRAARRIYIRSTTIYAV